MDEVNGDAVLASAPTMAKRGSRVASNVSEVTNETPNGYATSRSDEDNEAGNKKPFHYPQSFLLRIPKSDLHAHLDGSIRIETLCDLAKEQNVHLPSYDPVELQRTVFPETYLSLEEYLRGFGYMMKVLRTPDALERVAYEVAIDAFNVGVRYLEVRFAPQLHAIPGSFTIEEVVCSVNRGLVSIFFRSCCKPPHSILIIYKLRLAMSYFNHMYLDCHAQERAVIEADGLDKLSGKIDDFNSKGGEDYDKETIKKLERL